MTPATFVLLLLLAAIAAGPLAALSVGDRPAILAMRDRAALRDRLVGERLDAVVPKLMRREETDMWIVVCREYAEDPVFRSMSPSSWMSARRRTILVFFDPGEDRPVERLAVARYGVDGLFEGAWDKSEQPDQWARLAEIVAERDPKRIAVNRSATFALADGATWSELEALSAVLPERYRARLVSAERLAIGWLETRIPAEMELYPEICRLARSIHHEGLSAGVIRPGETTTDDLMWWYRERFGELALDTWFQPMVSVQRALDTEHAGSFADAPGDVVILPGDLLHVDLGIEYLGLHTDMQQHAYVLSEGESAAPAGLRHGLATGNRLQDLLLAEMRVGRTGNEVLAATRAAASAAGIEPSIYTHPLGLHGHAAGATIGLWDQQDGVRGAGDYPVQPDTVWSIELNATVAVPEWDGQRVRFMLEEDAFFDGQSVAWLDGRQTELILIR